MPTAPAMQAAGPYAQERDSANGPELAGWYLTHARGTSGVATAFLPASDLDRSSSHLDSVIPAHHAPYAWCGYGTRSEKNDTLVVVRGHRPRTLQHLHPRLCGALAFVT